MKSKEDAGAQSSVYRIAGVTIRIRAEWKYDEFHSFDKFMADEKLQEDICVDFKVVPQEIKFDTEPVSVTECNRYYNEDGRLWRVYYSPPGKDACSFICLNRDDAAGEKCFVCYVPERMKYVFNNSIQLFNAIGMEDMLMTRGVMVLHSSFIKWKGKAILFTAPSGMGKSTQAELWKKYENAEIINGDRSAISRECGKWYANGLPIAGSSGIFINETDEIGAIVVLRQAQENRISELKGIQAVKHILNQVFIQGQFSESYTSAVSTAVEIAENIPMFLLECRPDKGAVDVLRDRLAVYIR